jgi:site-specific DNA-methyltransferase (adenine-specific)
MSSSRHYPDGILQQGDCLDCLAPVRRDVGRFDLIYVDPPFNTGVTHAARVAGGSRAQGQSAYNDAWGGLDGFLSMLETRLQRWHAVLAESGSLWLHLDHRAVHDAKVLADKVFGPAGYRGEIIWVPGNGARRKRGPSVTHQTILIYARGKNLTYNSDASVAREPYAETSRSMHFRNVDSDGRRYRERLLGGKRYRYYEDQGRRIGSVWLDCPAMLANTPLIAETSGYPTQKPLKLLERIVVLGSQPGDRVLDPMCGSGTTLVAARKLSRAWMGIDQSPVAIRTTRRRLAATPLPDPAKPRVDGAR